MHTEADERIDIALLPEIETMVGMNGAMIEVEVGGHVCLDSGVLIALALG